MPNSDDLRRILGRIDGRGFKAYRDLRGRFDLGRVSVCIDHVQGDPFAAPSRLRLRVPMAVAQIPASLLENAVRRTALADYLTRRADVAIAECASGRRGSGKSGLVAVDAGGQEVLERSSIRFAPDWVELRVEAGLPASGRRILAAQAEALLCGDLPRIAQAALEWTELPAPEAVRFVECVENQEFIRERLASLGLVAFVADGAILPRESGVSDRPLCRDAAIPFRSPDSLRVCVPLDHPIQGPGPPIRELTGMGIREGVTLIVGGGYHGKSTLLRALQRGVYPHVPDDGREGVVSRSDLVKIRAEDGRRVAGVDISAFVRDLPGGRSTSAFSSEEASGSTSQASNIVEALEAGASGLLLDEDTSAANFMLRDARMQELVSEAHEPITPYRDHVRDLYERLGVSSVMVMGGSGDYFDLADCVIALRDFEALDATADARKISLRHPRPDVGRPRIRPVQVSDRKPLAESVRVAPNRRGMKIDARDRGRLRFGDEEIDLGCVEQLIDRSQTRAIGRAIALAQARFFDGETTLREVLDQLESLFDDEGLDVLDPHGRAGQHPGNLARPRTFEIAAAVNRLRSLRILPPGGAG
jgi:predicted ABC-class ATPase